MAKDKKKELISSAILGIIFFSILLGFTLFTACDKASFETDESSMIKGYVESYRESYSRTVANSIEDALILAYIDDLDGKNYKLYISAKQYLFYKTKSHQASSEEGLLDFVTYKNESIITKAEYLTKDCKSKEEKARRLLKFVHKHIYDSSIEEEKNYVKHPIETMVEKCGDCEDLSILGAAMMKAVGIDVALISLPRHVALGISGDFNGHYVEGSDGKKYFYTETTGTNWLDRKNGWEIGQIPQKYKGEKYTLLIVK